MSLDDFQAQLRGTLDQQFAALKQKYEDAIAEARQQAAAEVRQQATADAETKLRTVATELRAAAERDVAVKVERARAELEAARAEWETQLHAVTMAARAEGEQAAADAAQQEREALEQKLEQAVDAAVAAARRSAELELESERRRGQNAVEAARAQAKTELEAERERSAELEAQRAQASTGLEFERILAAIQDIDGTRTLSQALDLLLSHASATAGRAAIFLINADRLKAWKGSGIPDVDVQTVESSIGGKDLLARAIQSGQATSSSASLPAPPFARLPADRTGFAVPLMVGGRPVAVLYADSGTQALPAGAGAIVEALVRHTSAIAALRTAMRTLDVLGGGQPNGQPNGSGAGSGSDTDDDQSARRFARLLVSEIKLYNEAAVRAGREQRDLRQRLRAEIDRAQRLYEERVPSDLGGRRAFFQQELVQTLADGDPALLGNH